MPYLYRAPGPQKHPVPEDSRITHSSGQSFEQLRQACVQKGVLFEDADFPANNSSLFYSERPQIPFVWKRPGVSARGSGGVGAGVPGRGVGSAAWQRGARRGGARQGPTHRHICHTHLPGLLSRCCAICRETGTQGASTSKPGKQGCAQGIWLCPTPSPLPPTGRSPGLGPRARDGLVIKR